MKSRVLLLLCALLAACAQLPPAPDPAALLDDTLFAAPAQPVDAAQALAPSAAMRAYLDDQVRGRALRVRGAREALIAALSTGGGLQLAYADERTRSAAEAFAERRGNCLSLVLMTAALAKELGLPVTYQSVFLPETWSRAGDLYFASEHVNVSLGARIGDAGNLSSRDHALTIDFLPADALRGQRSRTIAEATVVAMYLNNRAAETLAAGRADEAYAWARQAVLHAPAYLSGYNTLAVVYQRGGHLDAARRVLAQVLERDPANTTALANLVGVLQQLGRHEAAREAARRLARLEPRPPYAVGAAKLELLRRQAQ